MKAQADKTVPTKSKAVANTDFATHETGEREVLFEDRRPETVIQKQLAEKADNSPQAGKIAQLQAVVNGANVDPVQRQESEEDEELPEERPAQLQAHAFAQGADIHMAPGQEKHLPHEAWHVVQQKQGRVKPTVQMKGKVISKQLSGTDASLTTQRFRNIDGIEIDAFSLSLSEIDEYLEAGGLRGSAAKELNRARSRKETKQGIDPKKITSEARAEKKAKVKEARASQMKMAREKINGHPSYKFEVVDDEEGGKLEDHTIFVSNKELWIASFPLPVTNYINLMQTKFTRLEVEHTNRAIKNIRGGVKKFKDSFESAKVGALTELAAANAVFADVTKSTLDRHNAETALANSISTLIQKVYNFAKSLGKHFSNPGSGNVGDNFDQHSYTNEVANSLDKYQIEGLVAQYENQPVYADSGFERDHQPHNHIIETMAGLPQFSGKKIQDIAAGRTQKGWSILLHHVRHEKGRTYGQKGGQVTREFTDNLKVEKAKAGSTDNTIRTFCITLLKKSLEDDAAAMKTVASNLGASYPDIDALGIGNPGTNNLKKKIENQIINGEDRLLNTKGEIEKYSEDM